MEQYSRKQLFNILDSEKHGGDLVGDGGNLLGDGGYLLGEGGKIGGKIGGKKCDLPTDQRTII